MNDTPHVSPWYTAIAVMAATFMVVLDTTVVNVSLPYIAGSMSATVNESTWALTSYVAANAIILPLTGWLATVLGRKRLLIGSVIGFTIASALCGIAPTLPLLILFRIIQGATGGVMQPLSQAVLLEAFPPQDRGKAMGFWGLGIVVAPILGPVLGGWLTDNYSWRWVFYINIPIGVIAFMLLREFVHDPPYLKRHSESIDYWGIALMTIGIGALQIMLDKGQEDDWFESTLITTMGYPPIQAGIALAPRGMGSLIAMPLVGLITSKVDSRKLVALGLLMGGVTLLWLGDLNLNAGYWDFFWPQFLQGVSLGLLFVPLSTVTMGAIPREQVGNAASVFNLVRNIGGGVGIASVTTMLTRFRVEHAATMGEHISLYDARIRAQVGPLTDVRAVAGLQGQVMRQAALMSFIDSFRIMGVVFLALLPLVLLMRRQAPHGSEQVVVATE